MTLTGKRMTAEELWRLPDDGMRHELIDGELTTISPGGSEHGRIAMRFGSRLDWFVEQHQLGQVYAAETGFLLARQPDLVRAPDAAFVRRERLVAAEDATGYFPGAPDLAVEVVSPNDRPSEVEAKVAAWLAHGTLMVIAVYPRSRTARIHRPGQPVRELSEADTIDGADVVAGWTLPLRELFG
jgi:Uma2 family endonuclease